METITLRCDELEALRLADFEGLYQEACAQRMGISRTTFSRMLAQARRKVTDALLNGKQLIVVLNPDVDQLPSFGVAAAEHDVEPQPDD